MALNDTFKRGERVEIDEKVCARPGTGNLRASVEKAVPRTDDVAGPPLYMVWIDVYGAPMTVSPQYLRRLSVLEYLAEAADGRKHYEDQ